MDALVTGIAVLAVIALSLRWAKQDERSTSPGGAGRTAHGQRACGMSRGVQSPRPTAYRDDNPALADRNRDTARRWNGEPVNTKRL